MNKAMPPNKSYPVKLTITEKRRGEPFVDKILSNCDVDCPGCEECEPMTTTKNDWEDRFNKELCIPCSEKKNGNLALVNQPKKVKSFIRNLLDTQKKELREANILEQKKKQKNMAYINNNIDLNKKSWQWFFGILKPKKETDVKKLKKEFTLLGLDKKTLRYLLDVKTLYSLKIKYVTRRQINNAMKSWFYNPIYYYPKYSRKIKNEVGHDEKYRYVLL